jgi:hypothetical protein
VVYCNIVLSLGYSSLCNQSMKEHKHPLWCPQ